MIGGGGLVAVLLSNVWGYSGSGPLAAIILSFLSSLCWKWQGWSNTYVSVLPKILSFLFAIFTGNRVIILKKFPGFHCNTIFAESRGGRFQ